MITFGLSMREKIKFVPKELRDWVVWRNCIYPAIIFEINYQESSWRSKEDFEKDARKCSFIFHFHKYSGGVKHVEFPYLKEKWLVRIIGRVNPLGAIVGSEYPKEYTRGLPAALKNKIAGMPDESTLTILSDGIKGIRRGRETPPMSEPERLVPLFLEKIEITK